VRAERNFVAEDRGRRERVRKLLDVITSDLSSLHGSLS